MAGGGKRRSNKQHSDVKLRCNLKGEEEQKKLEELGLNQEMKCNLTIGQPIVELVHVKALE